MTESTDTADWILPRRFGRYEIVRRLGVGGMAEVYLANDANLDRQVAIKTPIIRSDDCDESLARFQTEARAASRLQHSGICPVYEAGDVEGTPYLAMLFVEGTSLNQWMENREIPLQQALQIIRQLCDAVHHAHESGIIHRDLKPGNIMMTSDDNPVIMDFGLTRDLTYEGSALTPAGMTMGSPSYMSPEQILADDRVTTATDIYSLGVVMYELVTGWLPFSGSVTRLVTSIVSQPPPPLRTYILDLDPQLESICLRALEKDPQDRFPSAEAMANAIRNVQNGSTASPGTHPSTDATDADEYSKTPAKKGLIQQLAGLFRGH